MKTKRYTVGSLSGYTNTGSHSTIWYVHDSAYGYQIVTQFQGAHAEQDARNFADRLNHKPKIRKLDPITTYLGYPIIATPGGFFVHDHRVGSVAAARSYIKKLRRGEREAA